MSLVWILAIFIAAFVLVIWGSFFRQVRAGIFLFFWLVLGLGTAFALVSLISNLPSSAAPEGFFWFTLVIVLAYALSVFLILRSGHSYSVHDTEAHSTDYGGVIKEGHGGLTAFLWLSYIAIFVWTVIYLAQHWSEFGVIFNS